MDSTNQPGGACTWYMFKVGPENHPRLVKSSKGFLNPSADQLNLYHFSGYHWLELVA
jgi:hypothetical protein